MPAKRRGLAEHRTLHTTSHRRTNDGSLLCRVLVPAPDNTHPGKGFRVGEYDRLPFMSRILPRPGALCTRRVERRPLAQCGAGPLRSASLRAAEGSILEATIEAARRTRHGAG